MTVLHILISGKVQGVGYRAFVQRAARELRLGGRVRNLDDGRVEVIAAGADEVLAQLRQRLLEGPPSAVVEALVAKEVAAKQEYERFLIVEDGSEPWSVD